MEPIITVRNLSKTYAGPTRVVAVDDVSFSLMPGEVLGIVGESGSGKSTVAKLVTRLIDPTAGTILVKGQDITHLRGKALRPVYETMQLIFQTPATSFDPRRTLGDGIGERLRNEGCSRKERQRRVEETMDLCGLPKEYAHRYPHEVSGGQCQRAAIARALIGSPEVLILDEATSSLDVTVQQQILTLLQQLQQEKGLSYLFICHNLALVQQLCHRVCVMDRGRIVEEGTVEQVICRPVSPVTRQLLEAAF